MTSRAAYCCNLIFKCWKSKNHEKTGCIFGTSHWCLWCIQGEASKRQILQKLIVSFWIVISWSPALKIYSLHRIQFNIWPAVTDAFSALSTLFCKHILAGCQAEAPEPGTGATAALCQLYHPVYECCSSSKGTAFISILPNKCDFPI